MKYVYKPGFYNQVQHDKHERQGSGNPENNTYVQKNPNTKHKKNTEQKSED